VDVRRVIDAVSTVHDRYAALQPRSRSPRWQAFDEARVVAKLRRCHRPRRAIDARLTSRQSTSSKVKATRTLAIAGQKNRANERKQTAVICDAVKRGAMQTRRSVPRDGILP
jgi:hypothetical protein